MESYSVIDGGCPEMYTMELTPQQHDLSVVASKIYTQWKVFSVLTIMQYTEITLHGRLVFSRGLGG